MALTPFIYRWRVRTKIAVLFSILVATISLFIYSFFPRELTDLQFEALSEKTRSITKMTAYSIGPALFFDDTTAALRALANARQDTNIVFAVLTNDSGVVFAAYNREEANRYAVLSVGRSQPDFGEGDILAMKEPVKHNDRVIGQLSIGMSLSRLHVRIRETKLTIFLVSLLIFMIGVAVVYGLTMVLTEPLRKVAVTASRIARGDLSQRVSVRSHDEVGELSHIFNEMVANLQSTQEQLQRMNADLERRVEERTERLTLSEQALRQSGEQLRALSVHLQTVREEERTYLAREIHDVIGQLLTAINIDIAVAGKYLQKADPSAAVSQAIDKIGLVSELVEGTIRNIRRLALELRPDVLDSLGLVAALEWQVREFQNRTGVKCEMNLRTAAAGLDDRHSIALFRILQEALTNIARHAGATRAEILLEEASGALVLEIRDNGRGIKQSEILDIESLGILGMRERVLALGGELHIVGKEGLGTTVRVDVPSRDFF